MNTEELLRTLDSSTEPSDAQRQRASALLERTVLEPVEPTKHGWGRLVAGPRNVRRVGALLVAAAAVTALAITISVVTPQSAAVASWAPDAEAVSPADLVIAEKECRASLGDQSGSADIPLLLSERRGDVVALLLYRDNPETASSCVLDFPRGSDSPREVSSASGGGSGPAMIPQANGFLEGAISQDSLGGQVLSVVTGSVGAGVKSITVQGDGEPAIATIVDGHFAIWLPGSVFINTDAPSGQGGPQVALTYTLVLDDGTVINDAQSILP